MKLISAALFLIASLATASAKPVPVIFDTDITGDVDDVLALAMLHSLADRGVCEILAVTISKENELAAPFVDAVNTFYGRPDIPIGVPADAPFRESKYLKLALERDGEKLRYPRDIGVSADPQKALPLLRQVLQSAADNSVVVIQVGLATNLTALLESEGGKALVSGKVDHLSVMAGAFTAINDNNRYLEANVTNGIDSMQRLADQWPDRVPIIWSGFSIGAAAPFPRESIVEDLDYVAHHPVKEAYLLHSGPDHDRPTWDLTSILYSLFPDRGYFDLSAPGRVTVDDDGFTEFAPAWGNSWLPRDTSSAPAAKTRDRFLKVTEAQAARVQEALVHFVVQPPRDLAAAGEPTVKLILDTDMGNDIDDAMALAMIHSLERRGACELIAVTSTKDHPKSVAYIDALNTYYGRPDVPIGAVRDGVTPKQGRFIGLADNYPHDLEDNTGAEDAVTLLRKTLAAQPDNSVTIAQVGFFTNLARLLQTSPDEHSPLSGAELIRAKVKQLVIMAGAFQTIRDNTRHLEYNVVKDIPSAQDFVENWTAPIVWTGFEIGISAAYPWESVLEDFEYDEQHPVKESYLAWVPEKPHDRPTWDLTAVLYAVFPDRGYFDLSSPGKVTVADDGATIFAPAHKANSESRRQDRDRFFIMDAVQAERVREALVQLTSEPPASN